MRPQRTFPGKIRVPLSPKDSPISHHTFSRHHVDLPVVLSPIKETILEPIIDQEESDNLNNDQAVSGSTSSTISPVPPTQSLSIHNQLSAALKHHLLETPKLNPKYTDPNTPTAPKRINRGMSRNAQHGLPPSRTSSASPTRCLSFTTDHSYNSKVFPISSQQALESYSAVLSTLEKEEILKYSQVYFLSAIFDKENIKFEDREGMFIPLIGDHLAYRYEILSELGKGTFGVVLKCIDHKKNEKVAIKIIKNSKEYKESGEIEDSVLNTLENEDPDDSMCIVRKKKKFYFRGHLCLVFELLSLNLYELLSKKESKGIEMSLIKRFATQILIGLKYIHSKGIIHGDLKPENILLRQENKSSIKIIDFGSICKIGERLYTYLQSRFYRAPEVVLGAGYNTQIDMWSLGCILAELALGRPLFPAENQHELILRMVTAKGKPSESLLSKSRKRLSYFDNNDEPIYTEKRFNFPSTKLLSEQLGGLDSKFVDFVQKCLEWDPDERITAELGLQHEWIKGAGVRKLSRVPLYRRTVTVK
ncbi:unnamed protein product [Blepharisma stoltei]|uniref:dual-specificity kinase n=1 Tax=Blepharisma stoltei TaxID=1481888 RepID=A0AAU9J7P0_9CILI|nr:unnamed protein product [Blepharisma stoltei]